MGLFQKKYELKDDESGVSEVLPPLPRRPQPAAAQPAPKAAGYPYALRGTPQAPPPAPMPREREVAREIVVSAAPEPARVAPPPAPAATPPPVVAQPIPQSAPIAPPPAKSAFGIEEAMRLLRRLRERDNAAVREAVQQTLEFLHIDVGQVIDGAAAKDAQLGVNIERLRREIEQHEALALAAKKQIAAHENERAELASAKSWLLARQREAAAGLEEPIALVRAVR